MKPTRTTPTPGARTRRAAEAQPEPRLARVLRLQRLVVTGAALLLGATLVSYTVTGRADAEVEAAETKAAEPNGTEMRSHAPRAVAGRPDWKDLWTTQRQERLRGQGSRGTILAHIREIISEGSDCDWVDLVSREDERHLEQFVFALGSIETAERALTLTKLIDENGRRSYRVKTSDPAVSAILDLERRDDGWYLVGCPILESSALTRREATR